MLGLEQKIHQQGKLRKLLVDWELLDLFLELENEIMSIFQI